MQVRQCEICAKRAARYVCQECGRQVCERCLEPHIWICFDCYRRLKGEAPAMRSFLWSLSLKLFFLGFLLMFVGIVVVMTASLLYGGLSGFVWVLPFPPVIVGAEGSYTAWAIVLAVFLTVFGIILFVLFFGQARKIRGIPSEQA